MYSYITSMYCNAFRRVFFLRKPYYCMTHHKNQTIAL